jgi:prepilin-type N-terminal cleavage/methylation domain-containing protein
MYPPFRTSRAFTLIEMLTVMAVIIILAGIVIPVYNLVQIKGARAKATAQIQAITVGCEKYQADCGSYPQTTDTNTLDPRVHGDPNNALYKAASLTLYRALSGDLDGNRSITADDGRFNIDGNLLSPVPATPAKPTAYCPELLNPDRVAVSSTGRVLFLKDPFGNSFGYSTKGAVVDQQYQIELAKSASASRPAAAGYQPTYDVWSTAGKSNLTTAAIGTSADETNIWVKNW